MDHQDTQIRHATWEDWEDILAIYDAGRQYMASHGNPTQWGTSSPSEDEVREDILRQRSFVYEVDHRAEGVFVLMAGEDPAYVQIEDGHWPNEAPYHVIHRIASAGRVKGVFHACISWCIENCGTLRIDTHADNRTMLHLIEKHGFQRCGIIHVADGTPRIAFQRDAVN